MCAGWLHVPGETPVGVLQNVAEAEEVRLAARAVCGARMPGCRFFAAVAGLSAQGPAAYRFPKANVFLDGSVQGVQGIFAWLPKALRRGSPLPCTAARLAHAGHVAFGAQGAPKPFRLVVRGLNRYNFLSMQANRTSPDALSGLQGPRRACGTGSAGMPGAHGGAPKGSASGVNAPQARRRMPAA